MRVTSTASTWRSVSPLTTAAPTTSTITKSTAKCMESVETSATVARMAMKLACALVEPLRQTAPATPQTENNAVTNTGVLNAVSVLLMNLNAVNVTAAFIFLMEVLTSTLRGAAQKAQPTFPRMLNSQMTLRVTKSSLLVVACTELKIMLLWRTLVVYSQKMLTLR